MTTHHREPVICECGHKGIVRWSENDAPFTRQWETYSISGFEGAGFSIDGFSTVPDALKRMMPKCPACGATALMKSIVMRRGRLPRAPPSSSCFLPAIHRLNTVEKCHSGCKTSSFGL